MAILARRLTRVLHLALWPALASVGTQAQSPDTSKVNMYLEAGGYVSTSRWTPFWLRANQYGISPLSAPVATLRFGIRKDYAADDTTTNRRHRFGWGFGVNPVVNAGAVNQVHLPEAYVKVKYGIVEFYAGRRREVIGLGDSTLSSGFIIGSGNALPVPKVQLATRGYVPLKFLKNFVAVNAGFAHGWFNVPYIRGAYLHQKYLYTRFGKPSSSVKFHMGLNHQVLWGGEAEYLKQLPFLAKNGKLISSFKYYGNVITGTVPSGNRSQEINEFDSYALGNTVGSIDLALEATTRFGQFQVYHQHIFDDKSGLYFQNLPDGLTGISWKRQPSNETNTALRINRIVVEFLSTMDQTGPAFWLPNSVFQGNDNYFNHTQYIEGWSYFGRAIGTPFIVPWNEMGPEALRSGWGGFFPNNLVNVFYLGAEGLLFNQIKLTGRVSASHNFGTYLALYPAPYRQVSTLLNAQVPLRRFSHTVLTTSLALDLVQLYPSLAGAFVSVRKSW
ncbi:capsule assembly Wzi family protein [Nibrella saemangeumensis]|uniref:Capsule assembly Wzi family protein n=1 Tax=Nibrella saemangeumensis TaxID=1084526 RepID=A0ABP8MYB9_9BACT